jgi:hypothetical protein
MLGYCDKCDNNCQKCDFCGDYFCTKCDPHFRNPIEFADQADRLDYCQRLCIEAYIQAVRNALVSLKLYSDVLRMEK